MLNYRSNNFDTNNINDCILNVLDLSKKNFNLMNNIKNDMHFSDYTIKFLGKGGQGTAYLLFSKKCGYIVFKISKINKETENEIFFLKMVKILVDNRICPNFIYNYENKIINNYYYTFNEYANGTLEDWMKEDHSVNEWKSFMFQILYGIFVFQDKIKSYHADLKPKNILFKRIQEGYFKYTIYNDNYYVPTHKYLFLISDFGKSQSLIKQNNQLNNESITAFIKNNADLEHIESLPKRILVSAIEKKFKYNLKEFLKFMEQMNDKNFRSYYNSEKSKIEIELSKYPENIKNKMLLRSIIYYAIEKKYIKPTDIPKYLFDMKYPPLEIVNDLEKISSDSILNILKNFNEYKEKSSNILEEFNYQ